MLAKRWLWYTRMRVVFTRRSCIGSRANSHYKSFMLSCQVVNWPVPKSQLPLIPQLLQVEAEECFQKAIEIARKQQAKSLELRTVMSLVRLRQHQAQDHAPRNTHHGSQPTQHETRVKLIEAHRMLSEIYNWFTEEFDTKDLQEARALLEELGANADEVSCGREKT